MFAGDQRNDHQASGENDPPPRAPPYAGAQNGDPATIAPSANTMDEIPKRPLTVAATDEPSASSAMSPLQTSATARPTSPEKGDPQTDPPRPAVARRAQAQGSDGAGALHQVHEGQQDRLHDEDPPCGDSSTASRGRHRRGPP